MGVAVTLLFFEALKGQSAPKLEGDVVVEGAVATLEAARGRPAVIAFFETRCADCAAVLSDYQTLAEANEEHASFFAAAVDDPETTTAEDIRRVANVTFTVVWDKAASAATKPDKPLKQPTTFVLDDRGVVRQRLDGSDQSTEASEWLALLILR